MKATNQKVAPKTETSAKEFTNYFIKYLTNKKLTFYKKLEKIEVLKLKDRSKLEKEQIAMIEKTPLWHQKISEWNKIQAYYMESINKYKPELLNPFSSQSEEALLRQQIQQLKLENAKLRGEKESVEQKLT